ncbi:SUKH-4 family immunity protein [Glycomyces xiaoerkulensis]|uniref:SUKH-4 family immunity protein n=1 Tax=Glycomyces xiaoerkulensis TaxID=2038139 RepID=UPI000C257550|nr:SUKH-4 family immunity protein [Glycomyces xiaoerkulensis]
MRYPRDLLVSKGIDPNSLPEDDEVPDRVPALYTTELPGDLTAFDTIQLSAEGTDLDVRLIVVGAVDQTPSMLYVIDPGTGEVLQFDPSSVAVRGVNSNYRLFVACLGRIAWAMETANTEEVGRVLNAGMRYTLRAVDDTAFEEGAWWPLVFERFES